MRMPLASAAALAAFVVCLIEPGAHAADDPAPPSQPVRLIFIHHSTGENWLADWNGQLGIALRDSNYYVSDTNYGWGPDSIGDNTDIGHWWLWFRSAGASTYVAALYAEDGQHCSYSRRDVSPGGENEIVMFKSCFPNSGLQGLPSDPVPPISANHLRGQACWSEHHTVANAKGIYMDLLEYFASRPDKLFVVIAAPPLQDPYWATNARAFNQWLVNEWLLGYPHPNVFVFDFYNVLTTNGGNANVNDLGSSSGNHHRWWSGAVQHRTDGDDDPDPNVLEYPSPGYDDHPSQAGNLKATSEFVTLLNVAYNRWRGSAKAPTTLYTIDRAGTITEMATLRQYDLKRTTDNVLLQGMTITFKVDGTAVGTGTTNAGGDSTLDWIITDGPATRTITAQFAGDAAHTGCSDDATLTARSWTTKMAGFDRTQRITGKTELKALLLRSDNVPLYNRTIDFSVDGTFVISRPTSTTGYASYPYYTVPDGAGAGERTILSSFTGNAGYGSCSQTAKLTVLKATPYIWVLPRSVPVGGVARMYAYFRRLIDYQKQEGKPVTWRVDGTWVADVLTGTGADAGMARYSYTTVEPAGVHTMRCEFAGDAWVDAGYGEGNLTIF